MLTSLLALSVLLFSLTVKAALTWQAHDRVGTLKVCLTLVPFPIFPSPPLFHWPFPQAKRQDVTGIKTKPLLTHRFQWYICSPTVIPKPSIWWAIFQRFVPFGTRSSRRRPSINQSLISSLNGHRKQEYYELQGRDEWTFFVTNIPKKLREKLAHESLLSWHYNYLTNIASKNTVRIRHRLRSSRPVCL